MSAPAMPDKIWAWRFHERARDGDVISGGWHDHADRKEVPYIRADLVPQWQPIETAPKDGQMILVCLPRMMNLIVRSRWNGTHGYWVNDYEGEGAVSRVAFYHPGDLWMPMPAAPEGGAA